MNTNKYQQLKEIDINRAYFDLKNSLKVSGVWQEHSTIVSALFVVLLTRRLGNIKSVMSYIESEIFDEAMQSHLKEIAKSELLDQVKDTTDKYKEEILEAMIMFSNPPRNYGPEQSTPIGISQLAIKLLDIQDEDVVLDLGSGINEFLIQTNIKKGVKKLYGVELVTDSYIVGKIRGLVLGIDINAKLGNILSQDFKNIKANKVFSNPPLGQRWLEIKKYVMNNTELNKYFKETKRTVSGEWAYALAAIENTKKSGRTIVIMSNAGTWNKSDELIRKRLIENGKIEGIILLPEKLVSGTSISVTMIIFSNDNKEIRMVDALDLFSEGRSNNALDEKNIEKIIEAYTKESDISKTVPIKEIANNEYILNPIRYIDDDIEIENGISLGDISKSISRGSMTKKSELDKLATTEETIFQHLMLSNIHDGVIDEDLPYLTNIEEKDERYCVKNNDLIISKIAPFKVALAKVNDNRILATGNLYMIDIDENKANPVYVELFLRSELGMSQLNRYAKGVAMKSISIQDLKKIQIPNIPKEDQNKIARKAVDLTEQIDILEKQIEMVKDKKDKLVQEVI